MFDRHRWRGRPIAALTVVLGIAAAGCSNDAPPGAVGRISVVATTTVLGDVARNVAGEDAEVEVLLPPGADPHDYRASARQVAAMGAADLVITNGLMLEEGLLDVLDSLEADGANLLRLAELLDPIPFAGGGSDPHFWLDPLRMTNAARLIASELEAVNPAGDWSSRAEAYAADLASADRQIVDILSPIASDARKLVTNHDSLGYFADRYGFEVIGTVIPGGSTLAEPSSAALAELVATIDSTGVAAIFVETTDAAALAHSIAADLGPDVAVAELYTGSLGEPDSGADTLIGMLVTNAGRVSSALAGSPEAGSAATTVRVAWTG